MKKILIVSLLLCGFYTQADMYTKSNFINAHLGYIYSTPHEAGGSIRFPTVGVGYGRHMTYNDSYIGFFEVNYLLPTFEVKYGYEFMRQNTFSFGLDISLLILPLGASKGLWGLVGAGVFGKKSLTQFIDIILQLKAVSFDFSSSSLSPLIEFILPVISVRYNL